jgi:hypothetical protein
MHFVIIDSMRYISVINYVTVPERYPVTVRWPSKFVCLGKTLSSIPEVMRTKFFIHVIITMSVGALYNEGNNFIREKQLK